MYKKNWKKRIIGTGLAVLFLLMQIMSASAVQPVQIQINGVALPPDTQAEMRDGRVMLQMNEVFRTLGAEVTWVETSRTIIIAKDQQVYTMSLDAGTVHTAEGMMHIVPAPYISQGRTMVPLRFVSELLGYEVGWSESARMVRIMAPTVEADDEVSVELEEPADQREILLFEEATRKAVENSYSLRNRLISIRQLDEQRERSQETYLSTRPVSDTGFLQDIQSKQALLGMIQTEINLEITELQAAIDEDRIAFTVRSIFQDIITLESDLEVMELMQDVKGLELQHQRLKAEQGLVSVAALNAAEEEFSQFGTQLDSLRRSLTNVYEQLTIMTNIPDVHQYRVERFPLDFEVLPEVNLTLHTSRKASADPYVKLQERQIEKAEKNLLLFVYTGMEEPYEVRRLTLESEKNNLNALKSRLGESLQNRYQTIRQTENQYQIAQSQLTTLEEQARIVKTQLELGMVTEKDVLEINAALESKRNELARISLQHQLLMILFEAPYLAPDYLS